MSPKIAWKGMSSKFCHENRSLGIAQLWKRVCHYIGRLYVFSDKCTWSFVDLAGVRYKMHFCTPLDIFEHSPLLFKRLSSHITLFEIVRHTLPTKLFQRWYLPQAQCSSASSIDESDSVQRQGHSSLPVLPTGRCGSLVARSTWKATWNTMCDPSSSRRHARSSSRPNHRHVSWLLYSTWRRASHKPHRGPPSPEPLGLKELVEILTYTYATHTVFSLRIDTWETWD